MMEEQQFRVECDRAMQRLFAALAKASDNHDFEVDENAGAITIEFEEPKAKFVVSPNAPVRQIWVSALTRSFKLDWDAARSEFIHPESQQSLQQLMADAIRQHSGESVQL